MNIHKLQLPLSKGKFYRTRGKQTAIVHGAIGKPGTAYEVHGAIFTGEYWIPAQWSTSGLYILNSESDQDLISEQVEESISFEVGKFYRTRDGRQVYIDSIKQGDLYPLRGIMTGSNMRLTNRWTSNGKYYANGRDDRRDLVSEWKTVW